MDNNIDTSEQEERRICEACIGETFLKIEVSNNGEDAECFYCENTGKTISIGELADYVDCAFENHYYLTSDQPSSLESMMLSDKESNYEWERSGEPVTYAISDAAHIDEAPAEDVRSILEDRHYDHDDATSGEECPFNEEAHYAEKDTHDSEYQANWRYFETSLKTEARLFNREAESILDLVFEGLDEHTTVHGKTVIIEGGPDQPILELFRARTFYPNDEKLEDALMRPDREIGPPPTHAAMPGRMNARGISVFYGATNSQIALAEVRPPVGSLVMVAQFTFTRKVRLLKVEALREIYVKGSVFDSTYIKRLEKAKFLGRLSGLITIPVMPGDEPSDYLVTQAIADYLASRKNTNIDGIAYPSVQNGMPGLNVALFHKSSRVEPLEMPKGTKLNANVSWGDGEQEFPDYTVWEEVPSEQKKKKSDGHGFMFSPEVFTRFPDENADVRPITLTVDAQSVEVHQVRCVTVETTATKVSRIRTQERESFFEKAEDSSDEFADLL